jgi:hypothetical protein
VSAPNSKFGASHVLGVAGGKVSVPEVEDRGQFCFPLYSISLDTLKSCNGENKLVKNLKSQFKNCLPNRQSSHETERT